MIRSLQCRLVFTGSLDSTKSFLVWPHSVLTCGPLSLETGPQCNSVSHVLRFSVVSSWCERAELASLCLCLSVLHKPSSAVLVIFQKGHLRGLKPCLSPAGTMTLKTSWSPTWSQILRLSVWRQRGNDNNDPTIRISEARQLFPIPLLQRWRTKCLITVHPTKNKHLTHNISTYLPFWHICKSAFIKCRGWLRKSSFFLVEDMGVCCWIPLFSLRKRERECSDLFSSFLYSFFTTDFHLKRVCWIIDSVCFHHQFINSGNLASPFW